jgi:hypothetical protein
MDISILKAAMEKDQVLLQENHMDNFLPCYIGTAMNGQIHCRHKGSGAPPPNQPNQLIPEWTPNLTSMPLVSTCENAGDHTFTFVAMLAID